MRLALHIFISAVVDAIVVAAASVVVAFDVVAKSLRLSWTMREAYRHQH